MKMKITKIVALLAVVVLALGMMAGCGGTSKVKVIDLALSSEEYAFAVAQDNKDLLDKVNAFLDKIVKDGTFDKICNNYFGDGTPVAVESAELDESKDQLVVATNLAFAPFEYIEGDKIYGIDMEIAAKLADYLGLELVVSNMDFDAVCLAVGQQKCDIAMAGLTINEERKEYVTFTDSYYTASQKLITMADNTEFDACTDAAAMEAILNEKGADVKVGVQTGTTGQFYCEGDADWGFAGFKMTTTGYKNGSLAVQDLLNGNIQYVIIDSAPAACITEAINELQ